MSPDLMAKGALQIGTLSIILSKLYVMVGQQEERDKRLSEELKASLYFFAMGSQMFSMHLDLSL